MRDGHESPTSAGSPSRSSPSSKQNRFVHRHLVFALFLVATIFIFRTPLKSLLSFSRAQDYASHIIFIAPVSAYLIYLRRRTIFSVTGTGLLTGSIFFLSGTILWYFAGKYANSSEYELSLLTLAIILVWISGFAFCYGARALETARFPLLFLLLLVPIPQIAADKIIFFLRAGSAGVAYGLLRLFSVPVWKQGFIMHLPTLEIEVAKQCSGIRSSVALLITVLIVGYFGLRTAWRRALLAVAIVPILILKNGARIVAVCLLSIYVNRGFLHGWLHTSGGVVFYLLGLAILIPILVALRKSENRNLAHHAAQQPDKMSKLVIEDKTVTHSK